LPGNLKDFSVTESNKAIFLSYAKQDSEAAARICAALRDAGIEVWFDQSELRGGDVWDAAIRKQIKTCALIIPIISANTQGRADTTTLPDVNTITAIKKWMHPSADLADYEPLYEGLRLAGVSN
jgi:hypothetical protein